MEVWDRKGWLLTWRGKEILEKVENDKRLHTGDFLKKNLNLEVGQRDLTEITVN